MRDFVKDIGLVQLFKLAMIRAEIIIKNRFIIEAHTKNP